MGVKLGEGAQKTKERRKTKANNPKNVKLFSLTLRPLAVKTNLPSGETDNTNGYYWEKSRDVWRNAAFGVTGLLRQRPLRAQLSHASWEHYSSFSDIWRAGPGNTNADALFPIWLTKTFMVRTLPPPRFVKTSESKEGKRILFVANTELASRTSINSWNSCLFVYS